MFFTHSVLHKKVQPTRPPSNRPIRFIDCANEPLEMPHPEDSTAPNDDGTNDSKREGPPRPMNSFMLFRTDYVQRKKAATGAKDTAAKWSKKAADDWKKLPDHEKRKWSSIADDAAEMHKLLYPDYKYAPKKRSSRTHNLRSPKRTRRGTVARKRPAPFPQIDIRSPRVSECFTCQRRVSKSPPLPGPMSYLGMDSTMINNWREERDSLEELMAYFEQPPDFDGPKSNRGQSVTDWGTSNSKAFDEQVPRLLSPSTESTASSDNLFDDKVSVTCVVYLHELWVRNLPIGTSSTWPKMILHLTCRSSVDKIISCRIQMTRGICLYHLSKPSRQPCYRRNGTIYHGCPPKTKRSISKVDQGPTTLYIWKTASSKIDLYSYRSNSTPS